MKETKQKPQSPDDMLIELARAVSATGTKEIPAEEFRATAKKVGQTRREQLEWAVAFAQQPTDKMTRGDLYNAIVEYGAFLHPELPFSDKENKTVPFSRALFPSDVEQVAEAKKEFLGLIKSAAVGCEASFTVSGLLIRTGPGGVSYVIPSYLSDPKKHAKAQIEQAMLRLAQLLGDHWGYVGMCDRKRYGCGRYFLKSRTDQEFCTKRCLNRSTTYRQRKKEPIV